jgi:hypothetical protein
MTDTDLQLVKNDGTETFTLKATSVKSTVSMGVITKSLLGAFASLSGTNPVLAKETYELTCVVRDTDAGDYPNSGTYADDDLGLTEELKRAAKQWQPTFADGLNVMEYDTGANLRGPVDGLLTEVAVQENRDQNAPRDYEVTLEWTHFDVYVG